MQMAWGDASRKISAAGTRITLAITGIGFIATRTFAKFEETMVRVGGVTNTLGTKDFPLLEAAAKRAGETTRFTAIQSAQAMEQLGLAGFKTREVIDALPGSLQLASAAQIDIATAASIAAKTMKAFGFEAEDLSRINDTLVATFTRANTDILQLAEALKPVGPVSKAAGVSLEETAAILAKMADAGFQGSLGGTALRNALIRLAAPSSKAKKILKELGVNSIDPLFLKLRKIQAGLEGAAGNTEKLSIAAELFGVRGGPALLAVLDVGVDAVEEFKQSLLDAGGIAERLEQAQLNTLTGQFDLLKSAIEGVFLTAGGELNPVLRQLILELKGFIEAQKPEIVELFSSALRSSAKVLVSLTMFLKENSREFFRGASAISSFVAGFLKFIATHPKLIAALVAVKVAGFLGLTAAVLATGKAIGTTLIVALQSAVVAMRAFGVSAAAAWASATLGVSLLIAAIVTLLLNFDKIKTFFADTGLFDGFRKVWELIRKIVREVADVFRTELFPALKEVSAEFAAALSDVLTKDVIPVIRDDLLPLLRDVLIPFLRDILVPFLREVLIPLFKFGLKVAIKVTVTAMKGAAAILRNVVIPRFKLWKSVVDSIIDSLTRLGVVAKREGKEEEKRADKAIRTLQKKIKLEKKRVEGSGFSVGTPSPRFRPTPFPRSKFPLQAPGVGTTGGRATAEAQGRVIGKEVGDKIEEIILQAQFGAAEKRAPGFEAIREFIGLGGVTPDQVFRFSRTMEGVGKRQAGRLAGKFSALGSQPSEQQLDRLAFKFASAIERMNQKTEEFKQQIEESRTTVQTFLDRLVSLRNEHLLDAEQTENLVTRVRKLRDSFVKNTISVKQFTSGMNQLTVATDKAVSATKQKVEQELLERKRRLLRGKGTKEDITFLRQQVQAARLEFMTQKVNTGFENLIGKLLGTGQGLAFLRDRMQDFGQSLRQSLPRMASPEQVSKLIGQLNNAFNSRSGQIAILRNNISLLFQKLSVLDTFRQRREVMRQIQALIGSINQLLTPQVPLFVGAAREGVLLDPGLQKSNVSMSINLPNVRKLSEVNDRDIANIITGLEKQLQLRGHRV